MITDQEVMDLVKLLENKINKLKFKNITSGPIQLTKDFSASVVLFSYKDKEIEIIIGRDKEGDLVSLPQDLKVNYNFKPDEINGIVESIERCLKNGWVIE